jgi:hypothetical protein
MTGKEAAKKAAAGKKSKPMPHVKERDRNQLQGEAGEALVEASFPYYWVRRKITPDYALDLHVEVYSPPSDEVNARALGEHFYVQVKSMASVPIKTKTVRDRQNVSKAFLSTEYGDAVDIEVVDYSVDTGTLMTVQAMGNAVPVLLCLADVTARTVYYVCLNDYISKVLLPENPDYHKQGHVTVNIPAWNVLDQTDPSFAYIWLLGRRAKLYSAFNTFAYQLNELKYAFDELNAVMDSSDSELVQVPGHLVEMVTVFLAQNLRLDIWGPSGFGGWHPMDSQHCRVHSAHVCAQGVPATAQPREDHRRLHHPGAARFRSRCFAGSGL